MDLPAINSHFCLIFVALSRFFPEMIARAFQVTRIIVGRIKNRCREALTVYLGVEAMNNLHATDMLSRVFSNNNRNVLIDNAVDMAAMAPAFCNNYFAHNSSPTIQPSG